MNQVELFIVMDTTLLLYGFKQKELYTLVILAFISLLEMIYQQSSFFLITGIMYILAFYRPVLQKENLFTWIKRIFNFYIWEQQNYEK